MPRIALLNGALTLGVSRGVVTRRSDRLTAPCRTLARLVGKAAKKERLDRCLLPITLPVTVGLGENVAGTLNALVLVPASHGGRRPCARGLLIPTSRFPYSMVVIRSSLGRFARRSLRVRAMVVVSSWQSHAQSGGVE